MPAPVALAIAALAFLVGAFVFSVGGFRDHDGRTNAPVASPGGSGPKGEKPPPSGPATVLTAPSGTAPATRTPGVAAPASPAPTREPLRTGEFAPGTLPPYNPPSLGSGRRGEGEVVDFSTRFKTPEEREAFEAERRKRWDARLRAEHERLLALMQERLGLTKSQTDAVRKVLDEQLAARNDLVARLRKGEVARTDMEDRVKAIKGHAEQGMKATLTPEQWAGYLKLDPKDQVLDEKAAGPR